MNRSFDGLRPSLRAVIVGVPALGAVAAAIAATHGFGLASAWRWALVPLCLAATAVAERYPVKIGVEQKVSLGALPSLIAVLLLPPAVGPLTAAAGVAIGNLLVRRTWWEALFNSGNVLLAASVAAFVGALGGDGGAGEQLRAVAAGAVYAVLNTCVAAVPASLHSRIPYLKLLRHVAAQSWPATVALAACAVSASVLAIEEPVLSPLPLVVLPLIFRMNVAIASQERSNAQLQKVLAAQRRFLTDVSHQIATPLATIMTNLSILRRQRSLGQKDAVVDSVAEAERMRRMLARLRALAHADEDVPLRRELVDLAELTADVVRVMAAQARSSGVGLVTDVIAPARVSGDRDLLHEAVANLVDNAVRVSPPGGAVTLRVAHGARGPLIDVIDRGPGIEPRRLDSLFERFQRSDSGSGLGLAIARRVVERHGGSIRVDTTEGAGSTFTIELPAAN